MNHAPPQAAEARRRFPRALFAIFAAISALTLCVVPTRASADSTAARYTGADAIFATIDQSGCETWIDANGVAGSPGWNGAGVTVERIGCGDDFVAGPPNEPGLTFHVDPSLRTATMTGIQTVCRKQDISRCFDVSVDITWSGSGAVEASPAQPGTGVSWGYHYNGHGFILVAAGATRTRPASTSGSVGALGVNIFDSSNALLFSSNIESIVVTPA